MKKYSTKIIWLPLIIFIATQLLSSCSRFEEPARDKFIGAYSMQLICEGDTSFHDGSILEFGSDGNEVILINPFGGEEIEDILSVNASVSDNKITILSQEFDGESFSGNGSIVDDILTITLNYTFDNQTSTCLLVGDRFEN